MPGEDLWFYRRVGSPIIYVRNTIGQYRCYKMTSDRVRALPGGIYTLPPHYGRADFSSGCRHNADVRNQSTLKLSYEDSVQKMTTGLVSLPLNRNQRNRVTNLGMANAMMAHTQNAYTATEYAQYVLGDTTLSWEWCHLLANSMGGRDDETNIVAAVSDISTEQLAIENALQMYRCENVFKMEIAAGCLDMAKGKYLGNVIKYKISSDYFDNSLVIYLDCLNPLGQSEAHFNSLQKKIARWANSALESISLEKNTNPVTQDERNRILAYHAARQNPADKNKVLDVEDTTIPFIRMNAKEDA